MVVVPVEVCPVDVRAITLTLYLPDLLYVCVTWVPVVSGVSSSNLHV